MPLKISGKVVNGAGRGNAIGFRTANIIIYNRKLKGVYAVFVLVNGRKYGGVANIGYAPTFSRKKKMLEVHIFNFSRNIMGSKIVVELVKKLRNEKKFSNVSELTSQIKKDVKKAENILGKL